MRASTIGTNSINSDSPVYTIFLGCGIKRDRKREKERERVESSSPPHVCLHLFQFTCCRLPRCLSAPIPRRRPTPFSSLFSHFLCPVSAPEPLPSSPSTTRLGGYSAVSRNRTRNVSKEAMYRQRNDSPLLARSFSCLSHSVSAYRPLVRLFAYLIRTLL